MNNQNGEAITGKFFCSDLGKTLFKILIVDLLILFSLLFLYGCTIAANQNSDGSWSYSSEIVIPVIDEKGEK